MNASGCCCQPKPRPGLEARPQTSWLGRARGVAAWILPGTLLALMPKCPLCLAAYVALGTGVTLSAAAAQILLRTLSALCLATLALCVVRRVLNCGQNKPTINLEPDQSHP